MAGVTGGLLIHACNNQNQTESNTGTTSISLAGNIWIGFTPMFIAQEKGFFADRNIVVDFLGFDTTADSNAAFLADQVNAAAPISSELISLVAQDQNLRVVLIEDLSVGGDGILADNTIESIEDFRGKQIAVEKGTVSYFFLLQVLKDFGLSPSDVTFLNANPSAAAAAYQANNVDIAVTYAPYLQQANEARSNGRIIYDSSQKPTAITDLYIFDTEFIEENPQAVQSFVEGVFQGIDFLENNAEEGLEIAARKLQISPDALAADLKGIELPKAQRNLEMLGNPQSDIYLGKSLNNLAQLVAEQGEVQNIPTNIEQFLEPRFVEAAMNS
ncbi:ABC transporter substrate-binding protein [Halothece sp. PCC 7418]|uniref:ABC transporter substrate-binding protein n=1 Tax=Halothece sp. (strain PCC 7418) TaxID=65093 RepID=UPI0002E192BF|nr:ABC transporter substrate-binding protein [Halothece sp. PCC 7418]